MSGYDNPFAIGPVVLPAGMRYTVEEALQLCHADRGTHFGARRTWKVLNAQFAGHRISFKTVQEFVECCAVCLKTRLGMANTIPPIVRHLKVPYKHSTVGMDTLTISPRDKYGNLYLTVVVNWFTKHAF